MIRDFDNKLYVINAKLNVPFELPNLGADQFDIDKDEMVGVRNNNYGVLYSRGYLLNIEGFGSGSIEALRDPSYFVGDKGPREEKRILPAGDVMVPFTFKENGSSVEDPRKLPLTFQVVLEDLNDERVTGLEVWKFSADAKHLYHGYGLASREDEVTRTPIAETFVGPGELVTASFKSWRNPSTEEYVVPFWSEEQLKAGLGPRFVIGYEPMLGDINRMKRLSVQDVRDSRMAERFLRTFPAARSD